MSFRIGRGLPGRAEILGRNEISPVAKFPKSVRLLKHADFKRVYENGKRQFSGNITVFYLPRSSEQEMAGPRIGVTVSRALGGAVQRNRIKRRTREAVRGSMESLAQSSVDVVINPKKTVLLIEFEQLREEVGRALQAVQNKLAERKSASSR